MSIIYQCILKRFTMPPEKKWSPQLQIQHMQWFIGVPPQFIMHNNVLFLEKKKFHRIKIRWTSSTFLSESFLQSFSTSEMTRWAIIVHHHYTSRCRPPCSDISFISCFAEKTKFKCVWSTMHSGHAPYSIQASRLVHCYVRAIMIAYEFNTPFF